MAEPVKKLSVPAVRPEPQGFPLIKSLSEHLLPFVQPGFLSLSAADRAFIPSNQQQHFTLILSTKTLGINL